MKSFVCLLAVACCVAQLVSATEEKVKEEAPKEISKEIPKEVSEEIPKQVPREIGHSNNGRRLTMFNENESGPYKTHDEIVAELNAKELSPEQTAYLLTSYGPNGYRPLVGLWRAHDFTIVNHISAHRCTKKRLRFIHEECRALDREQDNDSIIYDNLVRYCHAAVKKVTDFCKDKMIPKFHH